MGWRTQAWRKRKTEAAAVDGVTAAVRAEGAAVTAWNLYRCDSCGTEVRGRRALLRCPRQGCAGQLAQVME